MRIALHDSDNTGYPNLALMKISARHKSLGDKVEWFNPLYGPFDVVYSSKVFTWTKENPYLPKDKTIGGGTGCQHSHYDLPNDIEHTCPDYSLYGLNQSYGFLTRGCPNKCKWCFVPEKEGMIRANADLDEFVKHRDVVLMDNNVLAHDHGVKQIEKSVKLGLRLDFNQGLDARLIDDAMAKLLGKVTWLHPLRLACDSLSMVEPVRKAVELLRWHNCTPSQYFCYVLVQDVEDALERVRFLKGLYVYPFCQPYRDKNGTEPTREQRDFSRWVNHRAVFRSTTWDEYQGEKNHGNMSKRAICTNAIDKNS